MSSSGGCYFIIGTSESEAEASFFFWAVVWCIIVIIIAIFMIIHPWCVVLPVPIQLIVRNSSGREAKEEIVLADISIISKETRNIPNPNRQ